MSPLVPPPPRWTQALLRAVLPTDSMGDAILGDLHEELALDTERLGTVRARVAYAQRVLGIVAHAAFDAARWRAWGSTPAPNEWPLAPAAAAPPIAARASTARRGDAGVLVLAVGVLAIGIVVNTLLFANARHAHSAAPRSALGAGAVVLALTCAGVAACVLCVGPRWLRRRAATMRRSRPEA